MTSPAPGGAQAEDHERALKAFDLMRSRNFLRAVRVSTYNKLIHCAASTGRAEKAFEVRQDGGAPNWQPKSTRSADCGL